jgi:hypothetical protein
MLIPAAKNVRPITESGIFRVSPAKESLILFLIQSHRE